MHWVAPQRSSLPAGRADARQVEAAYQPVRLSEWVGCDTMRNLRGDIELDAEAL